MNPEAHRYRRSSIRNTVRNRQSSPLPRKETPISSAWIGVLSGEEEHHGSCGGNSVAPVTHVASVREFDSATGGSVEPEKTLDECGCAPSPAERRVLWPTMS